MKSIKSIKSMKEWPHIAAPMRQILLGVLRNPPVFVSLPAPDQERVLRVLRHGRLLPWLAQRLPARAGLAPNVQDQLEGAAVLAWENRRRILWELEAVRQILQPAGIPLTALKGAAYLLRAIPALGSRLMADVDLLLPEEALAEAETLLLRHGWTTTITHPYDQHYYRGWMHQLPPLSHSARGVEVDIHHRLLPRTNRRSFAAHTLLEQRHRLDPMGEMATLSDRDMVLHGVVQLFQESDLTAPLRQLVELDILLRHFAPQPDFWPGLLQRAREFALLRPLYYAVRYTGWLLHTPVPATVAQQVVAAAPWPVVGQVMDGLVVRAMLPPPWPRGSAMAWPAGLLLLRGHWLRMPPGLLLTHLLRKSWRRRAMASG